MSEWEDKFSAILGNQDAMGQIMALARSLSAPDSPREPSEENRVEPDPRGPDPQGRDVALLRALRPYLRPERQQTLDRSLELLGMLRLLRGPGEG